MMRVCLLLAVAIAVSARHKEECGSEGCYCGEVGGVTCNKGYNCVARVPCNDPQGDCGGVCKKQVSCENDDDCPGDQWCRPTFVDGSCTLDKKVCVKPVLKYRRCGPGANKCLEKRCAPDQVCLEPHGREGIFKCADAVLKEGKMCKHTTPSELVYENGQMTKSDEDTILMDRSEACEAGTVCTYFMKDYNRRLYTCQKPGM